MLFERQVARKPDLYPWTKDFKLAMWNNPWHAGKFTFESDIVDFKLKLTPAERQMVTRALSALAQIEVAVKTFWGRLGDHLPHPSIAGLGTVMAGIEEIHNDAYEKLLEKLDMEDVFIENLKVPEVAGRVAYLNKHNGKVYGDDRKQYIYSLILFTLFVENVSLFSQFYIILNLNRRGLFRDASQQVKYTRNEELLHAQAGIKIINTLRAEYPELFDTDLEDRINMACVDALGAEMRLIEWMVGDYEGPDLNASILKTYVADRFNESLEAIGYKPIFDVDQAEKAQTFWMTVGLLAPPKVDFLNSHSVGYSHGAPEDDDF
ncbi:ribonucleotide-diphosphate reductase subunit beta [Rhizobium bangladeshense]|uniref:ribonucleotide-diphosphate reductase subunit beta n=1 Tax=Rhizobium TaxID=379 RepID=UPI001C840A16|nr:MULTISPECIES: ribonucleotide-diphosphate reductase subunit beta [Rhizobium]MBX4911425.1 ribonucleotide-diphosphate reductase subunit beta [Rhizobium bangladeshense]MBX5130717.1 ribonucleotide-diphosphate reductase subunit beta [Rhizobium lentis]